MRKNDNLKQARIRAGLSQSELADKLGLKQSYISKLERGDTFSHEQAIRISEALGVSPSDIIIESDDYIPTNKSTKNENSSEIVESLRDLIKSKDETIEILRERIEDLKERLSHYENKTKSHSA